jgi:hypothetical protein
MRVSCADCDKPMGEISGRIIKGWVILCADCHNPPDDTPSVCPICRGSGFRDGKPCPCISGGEGSIDWLMDMFNMKGKK